MRGEFEFINNIKEQYDLTRVGDDCAVLPKDTAFDMVVTADMLVENVDFRLEWTTPELLGHKALAVSISDIAAMGAAPRWAMLSIAVPDTIWKTDFLDRFYEGWRALAKRFDVELIGGDVSRTEGGIVIDSVACGEVPKGKAFLRSTAKVGDAIFVSGKFGGAAGGLELLESGSRSANAIDTSLKYLLQRQNAPLPRIDVSSALMRGGLGTSMIDVSDGFSSDLAHLCEASSVGALIENLPVDEQLSAHFSAEHALELALHGGEDFELIFTVAPENISYVETLLVSRVGTVTDTAGLIEFIRDRSKSILSPQGYRHF